MIFFSSVYECVVEHESGSEGILCVALSLLFPQRTSVYSHGPEAVTDKIYRLNIQSDDWGMGEEHS